MKIIYVHHGQRLIGNPPTQEDKLTELGIKDCNLVADLLNTKSKENIKAILECNFSIAKEKRSGEKSPNRIFIITFLLNL